MTTRIMISTSNTIEINLSANGYASLDVNNLGTPSGGMLTYCTGLPAAGVSGTAVVTNDARLSDARAAASITTNSTIIMSGAANGLLYDDGTKVQELAGGVTTLTKSSRGLLGLAYVTDTRASGGTAGNITLALADAGKQLYHPAADTASRVVTIPLQATAAFAETETIPFYIEPSGGTLVFTPETSSVKLVMNGAEVATATAAAGFDGVLMHVTGERWKITGGSLS